MQIPTQDLIIMGSIIVIALLVGVIAFLEIEKAKKRRKNKMRRKENKSSRSRLNVFPPSKSSSLFAIFSLISSGKPQFSNMKHSNSIRNSGSKLFLILSSVFCENLDLVLTLRNSLVNAGGFSNMETAEKQVTDVVRALLLTMLLPSSSL